MSILRRLAGLFISKPGFFMLSILLGVLTVFSGSVLLAVSALLISNAALHVPIAELMVPIAGVRFFGIGRALLRYGERYISHETIFRILSVTRVWIYKRLEILAPAGLINDHSGDIFSRIVNDVESMKEFYLRVFTPLLIAMLVLIISMVFLVFIHPLLSLILLLFFLVAGLSAPIFVGAVGGGIGGKIVGLKREINIKFIDCISGLTEVLIFGQEALETAKLKAIGSETLKLQNSLAWLNGLSSAAASISGGLAMWCSMLVIIPLVNKGAIPGQYLAGILLFVLSSFEAVQMLPQVFYRSDKCKAAAERVFQITDRKEAASEVIYEECVVKGFSICVKNMYMRYDSAGEWTLKDITFELPKGKRLGIVGVSGSGKSTLVNVISRLWDYERGNVLLDDKEIKNINGDIVRSKMAVVNQKPYFFNATIRENLQLANPYIDESKMQEACKTALIHKFIDCLPNRYGTFIGEGGFKLSGGQRQRLAIARAILKDSPVLVLDEPTAGLDTLNERNLLRNLLGYRDKSIILITHRMIAMDEMDEILVMQDGNIVERGSHSELLMLNGVYGHLWYKHIQ